MNVVLVHPEHGAKVAICEQEVEHDEKLGWVRFESGTVTSEPEEKPKRKYTRKEVPAFLAAESDDVKES